jgi:hypothetical protein
MNQDEVQERVLTKVCSRCSVQSEGTGNFCPNCGRSYTRTGLSKRTKLIAVGVVVAVLLGAGATAAVAKVRHDHAEQTAQAAADAKAAKLAREKADAKAAAARKRAAKRAADRSERRDRHAAVRQMEQSITKDARKSVASGLLDGPILYTSCDPLGGGSTDDLTALTTTFSCLAVNKRNGDGTVSGYSFHATQNWTEGTYSWGLGSS